MTHLQTQYLEVFYKYMLLKQNENVKSWCRNVCCGWKQITTSTSKKAVCDEYWTAFITDISSTESVSDFLQIIPNLILTRRSCQHETGEYHTSPLTFRFPQLTTVLSVFARFQSRKLWYYPTEVQYRSYQSQYCSHRIQQNIYLEIFGGGKFWHLYECVFTFIATHSTRVELGRLLHTLHWWG